MRTRPDILCIGSVHWDIIGRTAAAAARGGDLPGRIVRRPGGVALNIARALSRAGLAPAMLSAIGRDPDGDELIAELQAIAIDTSQVFRPETLPTDRYLAIEDSDGLVAAIADARSLESAGEAILAPLHDGRLATAASPWSGPVVLDGNLPAPLLARLAQTPLLAAADLRIGSASPAKAARLRPLLAMANATFYLNRAEAGAIAGRAFAGTAEAAAALVGAGAARVLVTDGPRPVAEAGRAGARSACPPAVAVARVTGAGDVFMAAHIAADRRGLPPDLSLAGAVAAAAGHVATE